MKHYAGIGSRKTPQDILHLMKRVARFLEAKGYILRSGGAKGADQAFASGIQNERNMEIYLPWNNFEGQRGFVSGEDSTGFEIAKKFHPNWGALGQGGQKMMTRNTHQVLGNDCKTPSLFIICWTPGASGGGGTGQAIRIAKAHNIPVYDLGDEIVADKMKTTIEGSV